LICLRQSTIFLKTPKMHRMSVAGRARRKTGHVRGVVRASLCCNAAISPEDSWTAAFIFPYSFLEGSVFLLGVAFFRRLMAGVHSSADFADFRR